MQNKDSFKQGLLKNSRLTETDLLKLTRAILMSIQQDMTKTDGKAFHLLEGKVYQQEDGSYKFIPSKYLQHLIDERDYPEILRIEEIKLLNWIVAMVEEDR